MTRLRTSLLAVGILSTPILAAFVAFLSIRLYSSVDAHLGDHGVQIRSYESDEARENFFSSLAGFAREAGFEVAINYSSLSVSNGEYRTYSSALKPGSGRVERLRFERGQVDIVYPLEEFPHTDPRQIIFIKGSSADQESLVRWLEKQGFTVETLTNKLAEIFLVSTIPILLLLSVLLCVLLGAGHALSRSREIGVHRLLGLSAWETVCHEAQRQRAPFLLLGVKSNSHRIVPLWLQSLGISIVILVGLPAEWAGSRLLFRCWLFKWSVFSSSDFNPSIN